MRPRTSRRRVAELPDVAAATASYRPGLSAGDPSGRFRLRSVEFTFFFSCSGGLAGRSLCAKRPRARARSRKATACRGNVLAGCATRCARAIAHRRRVRAGAQNRFPQRPGAFGSGICRLLYLAGTACSRSRIEPCTHICPHRPMTTVIISGTRPSAAAARLMTSLKKNVCVGGGGGPQWCHGRSGLFSRLSELRPLSSFRLPPISPWPRAHGRLHASRQACL